MIGLLIGALLGLVLTLIGTPLFIKFLVRQGYGQFIRDDGPTSHATKRGTPTMGGVAIILAYAIVMLGVCLLACVVPTRRALGVEPTIALRMD